MLTAPMPFSQRLSPGLLAIVILLHLGVVSLALLMPRAPLPVVPATPLFVSLIDPTEATPEPMPAPSKPIPPPPTPAPVPPPIQTAKPVTPQTAPAMAPRRPNPIEAPKSEPVLSEPQPLAPPAPVEAPKPAPPAPITQPRFNADYLDNPKPPYPSLSRRMGEEGEVQLRVSVDASGNVQHIELHRGSGFARLDQAALDTVKRWRFVPARQGNQPVSSSVIVPIQFSLRS